MAGQLRIAVVDSFRDELEMYVQALPLYDLEALPIAEDDTSRVVEQVVARRVDVVLTGILPGTFGIELIRALRRDPRTAHMATVVLTSLPVVELHDAARAAAQTMSGCFPSILMNWRRSFDASARPSGSAHFC